MLELTSLQLLMLSYYNILLMFKAIYWLANPKIPAKLDTFKG